MNADTTLQTNEFLPSQKRLIQSVEYMQWNSDATKLAVQYQVDAGIMRGFVMNADGTEVLDIPKSWNVAVAGWLPDASAVVYVKDYQELCTFSMSSRAEQCQKLQNYNGYEANGGTVRARIAPNGSTIALVYKRLSNNSSETKLFTATLSGLVLEEKFAVQPGSDIAAIAWSPDSQKLAYALQGHAEGEGTQLHVYNTVTKNDALLTPGGNGTAITQLDWVIRDEDRQVTNSLPKSEPKLVENAKITRFASLVPDQKITPAKAIVVPATNEVVFMRSPSGGASTKLEKITKATVADMITLPNNNGTWYLDNASPDGKLIALHNVSALDERQNVQTNWLVNSDGSNVRMLSRQTIGSNTTGYHLTWKSDSTGFQYLVPAVGMTKPQICTQDASGDNRICHELQESSPFIIGSQDVLSDTSKNNEVLVAAYNAAANASKVFKVDVQSGSTTEIVTFEGSKIGDMTWSPDGTQFAVSLTGQSSSGTYSLDANGANQKQIFTTNDLCIWMTQQ